MNLRLGDVVRAFIHTHCAQARADEPALPGAARALLDPNAQPRILKGVRTALERHGVRRIVLTNHRDCRAHGGSEALSLGEAELMQHTSDLGRAREILLGAFRSELPGLKAELMLAKSRDGRNFQIQPVEAPA